MILDMCILSHETQCFFMFGHVVDVGAGACSYTYAVPKKTPLVGMIPSDFRLILWLIAKGMFQSSS